MKLKILFQALRFACLPTLSVLVLLFFGFFSISKTIEFISSDDGWAITIRVVLVIAEIALTWFMYNCYDEAEKERLKKEEKTRIIEEHKKALNENILNKEGKPTHYSSNIYNVMGGNTEDKYLLYHTKSPNVKIIELIKKEQ